MSTRTAWLTAYVGLGSNLGRRKATLASALDALATSVGVRVECVSTVYESEPLGPPDQPRYLNAVAGLVTTLSPHALLARCQTIEAAHGRTRDGARWGARTLDLDLLVVVGHRCTDDALTLPHPGIAARPFVAIPLAEIAPALTVPGVGRAADIAARLDRRGLVRYAPAPGPTD